MAIPLNCDTCEDPGRSAKGAVRGPGTRICRKRLNPHDAAKGFVASRPFTPRDCGAKVIAGREDLRRFEAHSGARDVIRHALAGPRRTRRTNENGKRYGDAWRGAAFRCDLLGRRRGALDSKGNCHRRCRLSLFNADDTGAKFRPREPIRDRIKRE